MELGSAEHKQLLIKGIMKVSLKIVSMGLFIGVLFMIPNLVRENSFSNGLFYFGIAIVILSTFYSLILGYRKYQKIIKPFADQYPNSES